MFRRENLDALYKKSSERFLFLRNRLCYNSNVLMADKSCIANVNKLSCEPESTAIQIE